jgi:hypothetical protein
MTDDLLAKIAEWQSARNACIKPSISQDELARLAAAETALAGISVEAALTQSRAETAAAIERAAQVDIHYIDDDGEQRSHKLGFFVQNSIRALATADQTAALDAVRAEARAQGMREAAKLCQTVADEAKGYGIPQMTMGANTCRDAILAAIRGAKA